MLNLLVDDDFASDFVVAAFGGFSISASTMVIIMIGTITNLIAVLMALKTHSLRLLRLQLGRIALHQVSHFKQGLLKP